MLEALKPAFSSYFSEKLIRAVMSIAKIKNLIIHIAISCGTPSKLNNPTTKLTTKYPIIKKGIEIKSAFVATLKKVIGSNFGSVSILWFMRLLIIMQQYPRKTEKAQL